MIIYIYNIIHSSNIKCDTERKSTAYSKLQAETENQKEINDLDEKWKKNEEIDQLSLFCTYFEVYHPTIIPQLPGI